MRKIIHVSWVLAILFIAGCASSNSVNNGGLIQKRKHTKGFYWGANKKADEASVNKNKKKVVDDEVVIRPSDLASKTVAKEVEEVEQPYELRSFATSNEASLNEVVTTEKQQPVKAPSKEQLGQKSVLKNASVAVTALKKISVTNTKLNKQESSQKMSHHNKGDDSSLIFVLCIILAILLPPIAVLVWTNIDWLKVLICLLLCLLFYLPGMIYALLVVLDVI